MIPRAPVRIAASALLLGACAPAPPHLAGVVTVHDVPVAAAARRDDGDATTWTVRWPFVGAPRTTTTRATLDPHGHLRTWVEASDRPDELARITLEVAGATAAWTATAPDGARAEGRLPLDAPLLWLPAGGPALGTWPADQPFGVWDGRRVVPARITGREALEGGRQRVRVEADGPWSVTLDAGGRVVDLSAPGGLRLTSAGRAPDPYDPVALLRHPAPALPDARGLRRLVVRRPDGGLVTVERPLLEEIPQDAPAAPHRPPPTPTGVTAPPPPPLPLPPVDGRLDLLRAAHAAVAAAARRASPTPDCKAQARQLAATLRAAGVDAEEVYGLVWQDGPDGPGFVRHAWVRVDVGPTRPRLPTDPALGQLVADATHLPDEALGPLPPGAPLEVVEAVGPRGPVPLGR